MRTLSLFVSGIATSTILVVAAASSQPARPPSDEALAIMPSQNPHWRADGCGMCHAVTESAVVPIPRADVDLLCLSCHNGTRASREPHPIGRRFSGDQVRRPDSWQVVNDKLSCLTCHDVMMHCKPDPRRPATNPVMLRGPRLEEPAYCGQCHVSGLHQQYNPHLMLDNHGVPKTDSCRFCHSSEMPSGAIALRTGDPRLNNEETTLCAQCHRRHIDFFSPGHIGMAPSAAVLERMNQTDFRLAYPKPANYAGPAALPLANGLVGCATCHNPHQEGVFETDSGLGLGAMRWPKKEHHPPDQRLPGRELCSACHGF